MSKQQTDGAVKSKVVSIKAFIENEDEVLKTYVEPDQDVFKKKSLFYVQPLHTEES